MKKLFAIMTLVIMTMVSATNAEAAMVYDQTGMKTTRETTEEAIRMELLDGEFDADVNAITDTLYRFKGIDTRDGNIMVEGDIETSGDEWLVTWVTITLVDEDGHLIPLGIFNDGDEDWTYTDAGIAYMAGLNG